MEHFAVPKFIPHFPGTANEGYDTAEEVAKQGMDSIKQVVGGLQNSLNEVANGFVGGINAAHREAVDTVQDAILGKWSMTRKDVTTKSHSVGTKFGLHLLRICMHSFLGPLAELFGYEQKQTNPALDGLREMLNDPKLRAELLKKSSQIQI